MINVHPLIPIINNWKSTEDLLSRIEENVHLIDIEFITTLLRDITTYKNKGNINIAIDLCIASIKSSELIKNNECLTSSKLAYADMLSFIGQDDDAIKLCNEIRIDKITIEAEANSYLIEGNSYSKKRNHPLALEKYKKAQELFHSIGNYVKETIIKVNIARIHLDTGQHKIAEKMSMECEVFFRPLEKTHQLGLASAIAIRAQSIRSRDFQLSLDLLEKAHDLYIEGNSPIRAYYVLLFRTQIYLDLRQFDFVHEQYRNAREKLSRFGPLEVARVDWYDGIAYGEEQKNEKALELLNKAKKQFKEEGVLADYARILRNEGIVLFREKRYKEAIKAYNEAKDIFEIGKLWQEYHICNLNEAHCWRNLNKDCESMELAVKSYKFGKEQQFPLIILASSAFIGNLYEKKGEYKDAIDYYNESICLIEKIRVNLQTERFKISFLENKQDIYESLTLCYSYLNQYENAIKTIERGKLQSLLDIKYLENIEEKIHYTSLADIQILLEGDTIIIVYYLIKNVILIYVVTNKILDFTYIKLGYDVITENIDSLLKHISEGGCVDSTDISKILIKPVEKSLIDKNKIIIIPHKILYSLPFSILKYNNEFLIDNFQVSIMPNLAYIQSLLNNGIPIKNKLLAFSNPTEDLPGAKTETEIIETFFDEKAIFYGKNATKEAFFENIANYNVLHMACHSYFDEMNPQESGFIFSNGRIQAKDLYLKNVDLNLITLSSCMSGKLRIEAGDEIQGLLRSLIYSGGKVIIASLWEVFDEASIIFTSTFYENLRDASTLESFRLAILATKERFPHPIYWSAYFLVGDIR